MAEEVLRAGMTYDQIVEKYIDTVYRAALASSATKADADDVVQDVFLKLITSDKDFESEEHLKAWLIRVAINRTRKLFSTSWFKKTVPLSEDIPFQDSEKSDVFYALRSLPQKYRTPLYLYYYEDYSVREISECLNISEGTIKSQLARGRGLMKIKLEGGGDDDR